jgi:hypothetical protein
VFSFLFVTVVGWSGSLSTKEIASSTSAGFAVFHHVLADELVAALAVTLWRTTLAAAMSSFGHLVPRVVLGCSKEKMLRINASADIACMQYP